MMRTWKTWQLAVAVVAALIIGVAIGGAGSEEEPETASVEETTTTEEPTATTERATTTTAPTTTTQATTTVPPQPVEVLRVEGSADTQTDDFTVDGRWELHWQVDGGAGVNVVIHAPDGETVDFLSAEPGANSSSFRQGGTFYLDLSTFGASYLVTVVDVPG